MNQACLAPGVRRDVSVCTGLHVTTSLESASVHQGGEEKSVTKVQTADKETVALMQQLENKGFLCYLNNEPFSFSEYLHEHEENFYILDKAL